MATDCPFCPIPKDADIVWSGLNNAIVAFIPLNPVVPGHTLVVPRSHVEDFADDPGLSGLVMEGAAHVARLIGIEDANAITSKGGAATQTVKHLHLHLVPRREGDGLWLPWTYQRIPDPDLCMCGSSMNNHGPWDNHSPVSEEDYVRQQDAEWWKGRR